MIKEVRIYIEGGGDGKETKAQLRRGFDIFFKEIKQDKNISFGIIMCGSRNNTFRDFKNALKSHPNAFNILLVDAESPVSKNSPSEHLRNRDNWDLPNVDDSHYHLMVQTMEAWFIADIETLKEYYGKGFKAIPHPTNVETVSKQELERRFKSATCKTSKGEYHKIKHASQLLKMVRVAKVRKASYYCNRLFTTIEEKITENP